MKPVVLRVVGEVGGTTSFTAALTHLPLANTSAIFQATGTSIIVSSGLYTPSTANAWGSGRRRSPRQAYRPTGCDGGLAKGSPA